jgi:NAD+ diphosphatase
MEPRVSFTGCRLDRAAHRRSDEAWLAACLRDPATRIVPVWRGRILVRTGEPPAAVALSGAAEPLRSAAADFVFLGETAGAGGAAAGAWFAADVSALDAPSLAALAEDADFLDLRQAGARLQAEDAALLAYARALVHWHFGHRFCSRCGGPTVPREGGHMRACIAPACGEKQFPRTDPAVIMLVTMRDGGAEYCLLGRQPAWPKGLISTLAGFVEPGEALEEAVAREVAEEVGLAVREVRYYGSQPWPFPRSIMLAFRAEAPRGASIRFDSGELEDARWYTRGELRTLRERGLRLPYRGTIARYLIEGWMREANAGDAKAAAAAPPGAVALEAAEATGAAGAAGAAERC